MKMLDTALSFKLANGRKITNQLNLQCHQLWRLEARARRKGCGGMLFCRAISHFKLPNGRKRLKNRSFYSGDRGSREDSKIDLFSSSSQSSHHLIHWSVAKQSKAWQNLISGCPDRVNDRGDHSSANRAMKEKRVLLQLCAGA